MKFANIFLVSLVLTFIVPSTSFAQDQEVVEKTHFCDVEFPVTKSDKVSVQNNHTCKSHLTYKQCRIFFVGDSTEIRLKRLQCRIRVDLNELAQKTKTSSEQEVSEKTVAASRKKEPSKKVVVQPEVDKALEKPVEPAVAPSRKKEPSKKVVKTAVVQVSAPVQVHGFRVVDTPGRFVASTYKLPGMTQYFRVRSIGASRNLNRWLNSTPHDVRVVVVKHGQPIAVTHPGPQGSYTTRPIYVDLNNDGQPESLPQHAVDPRVVSDVYVSCLQGEKFELVYLVKSGRDVAMPNGQLISIWKVGRRTTFVKPGYGGQNILASNGSGVW
jgi:hypothetical protein